MSEFDDTEFSSLNSVSLGRHSALVDDETCARPVTKELLVGHEDTEVTLYVRVECDGCGILRTGVHRPHRTVSE